MKKIIRMISLVLVLALLTCGALAANIYNLTIEDELGSVKIKPMTEADGEIKFSTKYLGNDKETAYCVFENAVKMNLSFAATSAEDDYVVFMLKNGDTVPKQDNIVYINQEAGQKQQEFNVYPSELEPGTYNFFVSSKTDGLVKVGSLTVTGDALTDTGFLLGDPDESTKINATDALWVLRRMVGKNQDATENQLKAADTYGDGKINATDALYILRYQVGKINTFITEEK